MTFSAQNQSHINYVIDFLLGSQLSIFQVCSYTTVGFTKYMISVRTELEIFQHSDQADSKIIKCYKAFQN